MLNTYAISNIAILKYLAHYPISISEDAKNTHRYTRYQENANYPWGFNMDDLYKSFYLFTIAIRRRVTINETNSKKSGLLAGSTLPRDFANSKIKTYPKILFDKRIGFQAVEAALSAANIVSNAVITFGNALC